MWEKRISEKEKLTIFFGCLDIIGTSDNEDVDSAESKIEKKSENFVKRLEQENSDFENFHKSMIKLRAQIVEELNKRGEIKEITDLFDEEPSPDIFLINPVMFIYHLPASLQEISRRLNHNNTVEDFFVVYDGFLLFIANISPITDFPNGQYDVRNKIYSILQSIVPNIRLISPCLSATGLVYVKENKDDNTLSNYYEIRKAEGPIKDIMQETYDNLEIGLQSFYEAGIIRSDLFNLNLEIREDEAALLLDLNSFLGLTWKDPLKRKHLAEKLKKKSAEILKKLSEHSLLLIDLNEKTDGLAESNFDDDLFSNLYKKLGFKRYVQPLSLNIDSLIRVIEHIRTEISEYDSSTSTILSAIGGAVIGSALTIVLSYFIGII